MGVLVGGERGMGGDESEECGPRLSDIEEGDRVCGLKQFDMI